MTQPLPNSFHTIKRTTIHVVDENTGRAWDIRDDTPMDIVVQYIDVLMYLEQFKNAREILKQDITQASKIKDAYIESDRRHAEYLLSIFQHTYPETTLEEIEQHFASEDRQELAALFFILRTNRSSTQQSNVVQMAQDQARALASKTTNPKRRTR